MAFKVIHSVASDNDLNLIFRHLVDSYVALGDPLSDAFQRAVRRIGVIEADMDSLGRMPHQGTLQPQFGKGVREVTKRRTVFYFHVDDVEGLIRIVAIFFGGQDHQQHMLKRLTGNTGPEN
ncbi:MAG: type II toxin-antitoxin system RelE/ParE family toxin [Allorhizobium sp.]